MDKRLKEIMDRKIEIRSALKENKKMDLAAIQTELEGLEAEELEIRKKQEIAEKINTGNLITHEIPKPEQEKRSMSENILDSIEYRNAFMNFAKTGTMAEEFRAAALTGDNAAVIPVTVLNKIIEKVESYGNILPLVSYMNYPAGISVPTSELTSPAVFTTDADLSKTGVAVDGKTTGSVVFSAYPLVKAIGLSFMTTVQSLSAFEAAVATNVSNAMSKALENAIINGSGKGNPTGILKATAAKTVTLSAALAYKDVIAIKKAIPAAYRTGAVLVMNESTFYSFIGIVDSNGQPVARVNFGVDGEPAYQLMGTRVVTTDWMPDIDGAAAGSTVAFVVQLDKYIVNTAYNIDLVTYIEQATRNKVYQSFAAVDGKLVDAHGLVFINTKGA